MLEKPLMRPGRFLTAEWRYLAMINYEIDAIATAARLFYNENYVARRMAHRIDWDGTALSVEYSVSDAEFVRRGISL
jgi:hypothetical protein